ncbi:MAG: IS1595 family transposase [Blautia sp.]|nr:IS1595 family transposase [Blautia sp.]
MGDVNLQKTRQELLDYFSSLSDEELASVYEKALSFSDAVSQEENARTFDNAVPDEPNCSQNPAQTIPELQQRPSIEKKRRVKRTNTTVNETRICPLCGNQSIYKHGIRKGVQRYKCRACSKVFTPNTHTVMSYSRQSTAVWREVISDTVSGVSLADTASRLALSENTVFDMRHKILLALAKLEKDNPTVLGEITELDETYVLESQKGTPLGVSDRFARKRGGKATKRGLSNEQICVFAGVQREGSVYMHCVNRGKPSKAEIHEAFEGHVTDDAMYMTDGLAGYSALKKMASCQVVNAKKAESTFYHINHVNNLHSQFKDRYEHYRGVATKYMNRYLALMSKVYKTKDEIIDVIWNAICEISSEDFSFCHSDVRHHDLCVPL